MTHDAEAASGLPSLWKIASKLWNNSDNNPGTCCDIVVRFDGGGGGGGGGSRRQAEALALCFVSMASMWPRLKLTEEHA